MIANALTRAAARAPLVMGAATMAVLLASPSPAQQLPNSTLQQFGPRVSQLPNRQQPSQPEIVATHGDWTIQCQIQPAAQPNGGDGADNSDAMGGSQANAEGVRTCGMVQTAHHEQRKNVALTLILVRAEQDGKEITMMRVMAPIGVFLPTGVALEIDGAAIGRVPFARCLPQVCIAFAEASPPTLEKLKKGGKANFIIYEAPGLGMSMQFSLKGFTAALSELGKL